MRSGNAMVTRHANDVGRAAAAHSLVCHIRRTQCHIFKIPLSLPLSRDMMGRHFFLRDIEVISIDFRHFRHEL